jgi:hypothetical protein
MIMETLNVGHVASMTAQEVSGICRVCRPEKRLDRHDCYYHVMTLTDFTGKIKGFAWPDKYKSDYFPEDNAIVRIVGKTRVCTNNNSSVVDLFDVQPVPPVGPGGSVRFVVVVAPHTPFSFVH